MSARLARSSEVTTFFSRIHWFTPNCARNSLPFSTTNVSSNFSCSSRCHWNARFDGATIRTRSARPRNYSSRISSPAMIVFPAPASSASRNRTRASFSRWS